MPRTKPASRTFCPLEGHAFRGAPNAWVHATPSGELETSCSKCIPAKFPDTAAYFTAISAAIDWDPAGDVLHANFGGRRHFYRTFDDRYELIHAKHAPSDGRSSGSWTLLFRELLPDGSHGRSWKPTELVQAAYPTRLHYYNLLRPYRSERIAERAPGCAIVVRGREGRRHVQ